MNKDSKDFLFKLLKTPSVCGYEQKIQRVVKKRMEKYADLLEIDLHGNLIVGLNHKAKKRVMLAGHCDQIGMMVTNITSDGFIVFDAVGGIDTGVLPGARLYIQNEKQVITGVVGRKAIHLQSAAERGKGAVDIHALWIDIGAKDKKEAEKLVTIGDSITFELGAIELRNNLFSSAGLDDKVGLFVVMEALRLCARSKLNVGVFAVSTVQEEVGLRGARTSAYGIDPEVGIAVDVTHSFDNPAAGGRKYPDIKLGGGPCIVRGPNINPVVEKRLFQAAKKNKIAYQIEPKTRPLPNDANAIQVTRGGVAAASIGIPNRYMHSQVEVCHFKDLENSAKLLAAFIKDIGARTDFTPK